MKKILLSMLLIIGLVGCGSSGSSDTPEDTSFTGEYVIVSQDTYDRDNFSLIESAKNMHLQGKIKLLAVDVTGKDANNYGGLLFSVLLEGTGIPILVNQSPTLDTRVTPSSIRYSELNSYPNDGLLDTQRQDSTLGLAEALRNSPEPVSYVVGGHVHNLADLMKYDMALVQEKIKRVVIYKGGIFTAFKAEMNLSEGLYKPSGTSAASIFVIQNLPAEVELVILTGADTVSQSIEISELAPSALKYLLENGTYANYPLGLGDFNALLYVIGSPDWYGNVWYTKSKTCFLQNDYGAVITSPDCGKNQWYLHNIDTGIGKAVLTEYIR